MEPSDLPRIFLMPHLQMDQEEASRCEAMRACRDDAETKMSQPFDQTQDPDKPTQGPKPEPSRRPFDNSGLDDIPQPLSDDPPYRNWWAVEGFSRSGTAARRAGKRG